VEEKLASEIQHQLAGMVERLVEEFEPAVPREVIESRAQQALTEIGTPRVVAFLPILVYRSVREDLERRAS
jgi:hypothetical protein